MLIDANMDDEDASPAPSPSKKLRLDFSSLVEASLSGAWGVHRVVVRVHSHSRQKCVCCVFSWSFSRVDHALCFHSRQFSSLLALGCSLRDRLPEMAGGEDSGEQVLLHICAR